MQQEVNARWSDEGIADLIQKLRDDYIKIFLDERHLKEYALSKFRVGEISNVKVQFIKKDIKELLSANVDLIYYEPMIADLKKGNTASLNHDNERLFLQQIDRILVKYIF
jgi:hypothetical protein